VDFAPIIFLPLLLTGKVADNQKNFPNKLPKDILSIKNNAFD